MKTLNEMTGPELVSAYNEVAKILDEPLVVRFPSRAAGMKRVEKIRAKLPQTKVESRRNNPKNHGAAIAASWNNEETRAKRSQRNAVLVDGIEYRSVKAAFIALDMPLKMHIKFRMELKAEGKMDWAGKTWEIV